MKSGGLIFASSLSSEAAFLMNGPLYTCTNMAPMIDIKVPITLTRMLELLQSSFVVLGFTLLSLLLLLELQPYSTSLHVQISYGSRNIFMMVASDSTLLSPHIAKLTSIIKAKPKTGELYSIYNIKFFQ